MVGKLRKDNDGYFLDLGDEITKRPLADFGQLSIKNCDDIANGYDLDEVIEDIVKTIVPNDRGEDIWYGTSMAVGKLCFQKALELLGDKKFSENDMKNAMLNALEMTEYQVEQFRVNNNYHIATDIIHSLKQTEWDVEICCYADSPSGWLDADSFNSPLLTNTGIPKLDDDGCLILRRI